ncbi:MAG: hypothetical protein K9N23_19260 [Akkermansiaceae bacterium]|nr:hypothetical protein [Akkermansiaceae bacterium]
MEDIVGQVLSVIIFGGLAIMAVYLTIRKSRGHKTRQQAADRRGWEYQAFSKNVIVAGETSDSPDHAVLYRLRGTLNDASPWQIETRFRHTRNGTTAVDESASWQTRSAGNPNLYIHITPKTSIGVTIIGGEKKAELKKISLERGLFSLGLELRRLGIAPPANIPETVHQFDIGPEEWQKQYILFSTDEGAAKSLLKSNLQSALLDWALRHKRPSRLPTVTFCPQGVQVTLGWTVENIDTLDQLVGLGEIAVHASR